MNLNQLNLISNLIKTEIESNPNNSNKELLECTLSDILFQIEDKKDSKKVTYSLNNERATIEDDTASIDLWLSENDYYLSNRSDIRVNGYSILNYLKSMPHYTLDELSTHWGER